MQVVKSTEPMAPFDALLHRGDANPRTRSMVVVAMALDRLPSRERLVHAFERASRLVPRLRQRVVVPPVPLFLPEWVVDPDFELAAHLRFARLAAPGGLRELLDQVQAEVVAPLDPGRPLWQATIYEGFAARGAGPDAGPRLGAACVLRVGHAIADGVGAQRLFGALLEVEPVEDRGPLPPAPSPRDLTPEELLVERLRGLPLATARGAIDLGAEALGLVRRRFASSSGAPLVLARAGATLGALRPDRAFARVREQAQATARALAPRAPPSPLLAVRSRRRRCLCLELPLESLKAAGRAAGGSVNDAYLAAIGGALARYHAALGRPVEAVPLTIPVDLRSADAADAGNHFGALTLALPLGGGGSRARARTGPGTGSRTDLHGRARPRTSGPAAARARIAAIRAAVLAGREGGGAGAPALAAPLLARLPDAALAALAARVPAPDVQASNLPGPPVPLYLAGARVTHSWAFGPVPGIALMFTMQTLAGRCCIGLNFDAAAVAEPETMADCLRAGFEEVLALGGGRPRLARPVLAHATPAEAP